MRLLPAALPAVAASLGALLLPGAAGLHHRQAPAPAFAASEAPGPEEFQPALPDPRNPLAVDRPEQGGPPGQTSASSLRSAPRAARASATFRPDLGALQRVAEAQYRPYIEGLPAKLHIPTAEELGRPGGEAQSNDTLVAVIYHRSGFVFSGMLLDQVAAITRRRVDFASYPCKPRQFAQDWCSYDTGDGSTLVRAHLPPADMRIARPSRVIHFVRDPVALILSAYRYHWQDTEPGWEEDRSSLCHACGREDWELIFDVCGRSCSYVGLLTEMRPVTGVILEALNERLQIEAMAFRLAQWSSEPHVLHISVDHLAKDFMQTIRCIGSFAGESFIPQARVNEFKAIRANVTHRHVTSGKFENAHLVNILTGGIGMGSPWDQTFQAVRKMLHEVYARQVKLYSCPMPKFVGATPAAPDLGGAMPAMPAYGEMPADGEPNPWEPAYGQPTPGMPAYALPFYPPFMR